MKRIARWTIVTIGALALTAGLFQSTPPLFAKDDADLAGLQQIPGVETPYYLVPFDANGRERSWRGSLVSRQVLQELRDQQITDVFIFSHGWRGDVPDAISQYDAWVTAMAGCSADIAEMKQIRVGFKPLLVGLHWPSLPYGDEELKAAQAAAARPGRRGAKDERVELFAQRIADTVRARAALATILAASDRPLPDVLPRNVADAFKVLQREAGLRGGGISTPGADGESFDPSRLYSEMQTARAAGGAGFQGADDLNWFLQMLGYFSFWEMKDRARLFGETGAHQLLRSLQQQAAGRDVRFHLMGHSFGCIVVSACVAGPQGGRTTPVPVHSLSLVQGALSLWGYCSDVAQGIADSPQPVAGGKPGYFRPLVDRGLVKGVLLTTQSEHDSAVGTLYPWAAWWGRQVAMATSQYPKYGAVGEYGIRGPGCDVKDISIQDARHKYAFRPGTIYNLESSRVICNGAGASGAHSDICHAEVAHAVWQAAAVDVKPAPAPIPPAPKPVDPPRRPLRRLIDRLLE